MSLVSLKLSEDENPTQPFLFSRDKGHLFAVLYYLVYDGYHLQENLWSALLGGGHSIINTGFGFIRGAGRGEREGIRVSIG